MIYLHSYGLTRLQPMNHDRAARARGVIRVDCNRCPAAQLALRLTSDLGIWEGFARALM